MRWGVLSLCLLLAGFSPPSTRTPAIAAWESQRFGAFVHFSMNTFGPVGPELNDYFGGDCTTGSAFRPSNLDVTSWVTAFRRAGMGFAVLTTRHIGGFLLWNSSTTDYNSSRAIGRDVVAEFLAESRRQGLVPGIYYLLGGGREDTSSCPVRGHRFDRATLLAQLDELATRYGEIPYFWLDMADWRPDDLSVQEIYDFLRARQPGAIIHFNQHAQPGTTMRYFPTDVVNGEETPPMPGYLAGDNRLSVGKGPGDEAAGYSPSTFYLPFEFSMTSQQAPDGRATTPVGTFHDTLWFTRTVTQSVPARDLYAPARAAFDRGAARFLLASAPDASGRFRDADADQLAVLGALLRQEAGPAIEPGSAVTRVERLGERREGPARCRFTVGPKPLRVTKVGGYEKGPGYFLRGVALTLKGGADRNGFRYAKLATPITLEAGQEYELSSESPAYDGVRVIAESLRFAEDCEGPFNLIAEEISGQSWDFGAGKKFDGASRLEILDRGSLNFEGGVRLSARVKPDKVDGTRNILVHGYVTAPAGEVFLRLRDGRYEAGAWDGESFAVSAPARRGKWADLEAAFDGHEWTLTVDGATVARAPGRPLPAVAADWGIGGCPRAWCPGGEKRGFSGLISRAAVRAW